MKYFCLIAFLICSVNGYAQVNVTGVVKDAQTSSPVPFANVVIEGTQIGTHTDNNGTYSITLDDLSKRLIVSYIGYATDTVEVRKKLKVDIYLRPTSGNMEEVVVTGTMKAVSRSASPIPVEVYTPQYFKKNPTPNLFDALEIVNGVRPQINCNVCNTGDIHINGMEGPYTMILIDGMPIVSGLATVYGLSGIPNSIVERMEIVKGPASSLYGSEAMGGVINVITKSPDRAPVFSVDVMGTSWHEYNTDVAGKFRLGKVNNLTGVNYFNYNTPYDKNNDGFTDLTLQNRVSVFNKLSVERKNDRVASVAVRYVYEDRWGGEMNWTKDWRGTDSIYGESIYTKRWELIGMYQLPVKERIITQFSYNNHDQDSYYGDVPYFANQQVAFAQAYWDKKLNISHNLLLGTSYRYTYYDDNTPGTTSADTSNSENKPAVTPLPGAYIQDEWNVNSKNTVLLGYRYDYDKHHGSIHSPRMAYKFSPNRNNTLRASFGTGYRVVNLFTEDHAALTGAREVMIAEQLNPERSYNSNLNYVLKIPARKFFVNIDATVFYSYFTNKIVGDFDTDPNKIIYDNLKGNAVSQGISVNTDVVLNEPLKISMGVTYMDVYLNEDDGTGALQRTQQLYAPKWSGNFIVSYTFPRRLLTIDLTAKWNGPMRLPVLQNDYRPEYSPFYTIANLQATKKLTKNFEVYGGVKNLFDFVPKNPIIRSFDPFDKYADDPVSNPHGYTFDPSYNYASLQGARGFLGIRYTIDK
ncbi:MAG: TonB-dependent receptor [Chitinophagales bacterium]|nr:TonB-dependent receptor [Chitinophagaceae bacterium]MCB9064225.1 TonB-dependent receptor [Chitinophagales bacterium]